jgi:hypothetical protein
MEPKENPLKTISKGPSEKIDTNQEFEKILEQATKRLQRMSERTVAIDHRANVSGIHYHIRWHPTERLDWESFGTLDAANASANELRLDGETYTIEKCNGSCRQSVPKSAPPARRRAAS